MGGDGTPVATAARVDAHEQTLAEDRTKSAASDSMEFNETKHLSWSDAERLSAADIMHRKLLDQMQYLCVTVQKNMGAQMDGNFAEEGLKRQEENLVLKTEMCARKEEGLRKEESARKLVQNEGINRADQAGER